MTRQGNILSFNEVKGTAKGRSSTSAYKATSSPKTRQRNSVKTTSQSTIARPSKKTSVPKAPTSKGSTKRSQTVSSKSRKRSSQSSTPTQRAFEVKKKATTARTSSSRTSKKFSRQFVDTSAGSVSAGEGSRAALYKGEMGRQHKKASRMQNGGFKSTLSVSKFSFSDFSLRRSPKMLASLTVLIGLVFSCIFLYPSAQQYYLSVRDYAQAEAEYAAVLERNESVESQVNSLSSDEGIEDRARSEYGWVKEGENAVTVKGLNYEDDEIRYVKSVPSGSVETPQTWYSPFLDFIFGVE